MPRYKLNTSDAEIFDVDSQLVESVGDLAIRRTQHIPDEFFDHLEDERFDSIHTPAGEFHRVCSLPAAVVEDLLRKGVDVYREDAVTILAQLDKLGLDKFKTTRKRIG